MRLRTTSLSAIAILAAAGAAHAEADTFGLGTGRDGPFSPQASTSINQYAAIVSANALSVTVDDATGFAAGQVVLVWRATNLETPPAAGVQTALDRATTPLGQYELARIASVNGAVVVFTNPLVTPTAFAAGSQIIRIPEYTTVSIPNGVVITPGQTWNGNKGGVVAFFATGAVTVDGTVDATGAGFRRGVYENSGTGYGTDCAALEGTAFASGGATSMPGGGGAHKGEGYVPASFSTITSGPAVSYGYGNMTIGGGGGNCTNSGGGGGGHGGLGGRGGLTWDNGRNVGGLGGAALLAPDLRTRISFGGGGGAGEGNNSVGTSGGAGGGVVWLRGASLAGAGQFSADGVGATNATSDGGGGGGAGGTAFLQIVGAAACTRVRANGGIGGNSDAGHGPGGGGAGGVVEVQAASGTCAATMQVTGGAAGTAGGAARGAAAGANGPAALIPAGGFVAPPCTIAQNKCGGCVDSGWCGGATPICNLTTRFCVAASAGDAGLDASDASNVSDASDASLVDSGRDAAADASRDATVDAPSSVVPAPSSSADGSDSSSATPPNTPPTAEPDNVNGGGCSCDLGTRREAPLFWMALATLAVAVRRRRR